MTCISRDFSMTRWTSFVSVALLQEVTTYLAGVRGKPLVQQTVVTCMEVINRDRDGDKEVGGAGATQRFVVGLMRCRGRRGDARNPCGCL